MSIKFGTSGFRGIIGDNFTKQNVTKICQAIANIINNKNKKKQVFIGYDNRFMSENFAKWSAEVFAANNIKVELCSEAVSTPIVMFATNVNNNDYGIMITASHNPHIYNGIKIFAKNGKEADLEETKEIENMINNISSVAEFLPEHQENITTCDYVEDFVDSIVKLLDLKITKNIKVVCDTKHGSTDKELDLLFSKIGLTNYSLINRNRDAFFGFELPAPNADNIEVLKNEVINNKADIGFALDADGDRLAVVDANGKFIDNNYLLAIAYYFLVKYCGMKGDSVKSIPTANLLKIVTTKLGYTCHEVPVGFKFVSQGLIDNKAVVGGESSGGLSINGHILGKDSLIAIALCLKSMEVMNKSFEEIYNEVIAFADNYHNVFIEKQYRYSSNQKEHLDNIISSKSTPTHRYELDSIVYTDYIKINYTNGNWVVVRFSGTEPVLRIYAEAGSTYEAEQLLEDWETLLQVK